MVQANKVEGDFHRSYANSLFRASTLCCMVEDHLNCFLHKSEKVFWLAFEYKVGVVLEQLNGTSRNGDYW